MGAVNDIEDDSEDDDDDDDNGVVVVGAVAVAVGVANFDLNRSPVQDSMVCKSPMCSLYDLGVVCNVFAASNCNEFNAVGLTRFIVTD